MPKNSVTDPITDQDVAFAHLLLSGTMNDREAAEAAGLNPTTATYTKSKQRVGEYMSNHRAAVSQKLVDQEAEGLRRLNLGRDQILARLWELANLGPVETKGSIAGQIKAIAMIAAIEGLLPNRRGQSNAQDQPSSQATSPQIYVSEWMRERPENLSDAKEPGTAVEAEPATVTVTEPSHVPEKNASSAGHDLAGTHPNGGSSAASAAGANLESYSKPSRPVGLPGVPGNRRFGRGG